MAINRFNTTLRNLEYRLRAFKDNLPELLEEVVRDKEDVIIATITNNQLFRRGINGRGEKIMDYMPYRTSTIRKKQKKDQPTTRVTLKDTGDFYKSMFVVFDSDGFYITSNDDKAKYLVKKYGNTIFRLTDKNLTRILRSHIRKELVKRIKRAARK